MKGFMGFMTLVMRPLMRSAREREKTRCSCDAPELGKRQSGKFWKGDVRRRSAKR